MGAGYCYPYPKSGFRLRIRHSQLGNMGIFLNNVSNWFDLAPPRIESGDSRTK